MSAGTRLERSHLRPGMPVDGWLFDNGLRLLVQPDGAAPVVCVQTWLGVGSCHERPGKTGLAHLLEHLMFLGAPRTGEGGHPAGSFDRLMEEAGVDTNAATWCDWTFYTDTGPADALPLIVALEADRLARFEVEEDVFHTEREVVMNERRETVDDDPDAAASERLHLLAFDEHPYRHPTIGFEDDIAGLTLADATAFHGKFYQPANATVVVVGDVEADAVRELVAKHYGGIPGHRLPTERAPVQTRRASPRRARLRLETDTPKVVLGHDAASMRTPDHVHAVVLDELLFGTRGGRAHQTLVEEQGLCSSVYGDVGHFRWDSLWEIELAVHEAERLPEAEDAFGEVLAGLESVSDDEIARAAARLELGAWQSLLDVADRAEQIGFHQTVLGDPTLAAARIETYRQVSAAALRDHASRLRPRAVVEVLSHEDAP